MRSFNDIADIIRIKRAYRALKDTLHGQVILRDLAKTCHAATTTFDDDPHKHALAEGKRLVWLRIQNMMNMPDDEVWKLQKGE